MKRDKNIFTKGTISPFVKMFSKVVGCRGVRKRLYVEMVNYLLWEVLDSFTLQNVWRKEYNHYYNEQRHSCRRRLLKTMAMPQCFQNVWNNHTFVFKICLLEGNSTLQSATFSHICFSFQVWFSIPFAKIYTKISLHIYKNSDLDMSCLLLFYRYKQTINNTFISHAENLEIRVKFVLFK